jgi:large subunit ribosomal protein L24
MKIKKGDIVMVISGKDRGKTGKVTQILPQYNSLVVEGLNVRVRHIKSQRRQEKGQRIEFNAPLNVSKVMLLDPKTNQPTRVGYKILENGDKVRVAKKSKETL